MSNHDSAELQAQRVADAVTELKLDPDQEFNPTIAIEDIPPAHRDEPVNGYTQYDGVFKRPLTPTRMASSSSSPRSPSSQSRQSRPRTRSRTPSGDRAFRSNSRSVTPSNRLLRSQSRSQSRNRTPKTPSTPSSTSSKKSSGSKPKAPVRQVPLFNHLPDATEDAKKTFEVLPDCTYASKNLGKNDEAMRCECIRNYGESCSLAFL